MSTTSRTTATTSTTGRLDAQARPRPRRPRKAAPPTSAPTFTPPTEGQDHSPDCIYRPGPFGRHRAFTAWSPGYADGIPNLDVVLVGAWTLDDAIAVQIGDPLGPEEDPFTWTICEGPRVVALVHLRHGAEPVVERFEA